MAKRTYAHRFEDGPGGWIGWDVGGAMRLEIRDGSAVSRGPWWVDFNHAPPGAGYLHLLYALYTRYEPGFDRLRFEELAGRNRFIDGGFPTDFTGAELTVRLKGQVELRGAQLALLVQGDLPTTRVNQVLVAQPIRITRQWAEQALRLLPDQRQWRNMGSRHDRRDLYGEGPISELLRDVSCDIIFVLYPLNVVPAEPISGDPHILRAGADYEVDRSLLPEGHVCLSEVRIEFAS